MNIKKYYKHVLVMLSGTAFSQIINFLSYPIILRLYFPEDFGKFAIFLATVTIFSVVSCARFDMIIQISQNFERFAAYKCAIFINFLISITLTVFFIFLSVFIDNSYFNTQQILLLGLTIFLMGYCNASSFFLLKHEKFNINSQSIVFRAIFIALSQILIFKLFPKATGLMMGFCIGFIFQSFFLMIAIKINIMFRKTTIKKIKYILNKYRFFYKIDVISQLISATSLNLLNYLLLLLFNEKDVAYYAIAYRISSLPLGLIAGSLSQVFFQKASKAFQKNGNIWDELKFNLYSSLILSLFIFIFLIIFISSFIENYLGSVWLPTAEIFMCLTPMLVMRFISMSVSATPLIIGKPHILLINNLLLLLMTGVAFIITFFLKLDIYQYIFFNSILFSIIHIGFIYYIVTILKTNNIIQQQ